MMERNLWAAHLLDAACAAVAFFVMQAQGAPAWALTLAILLATRASSLGVRADLRRTRGVVRTHELPVDFDVRGAPPLDAGTEARLRAAVDRELRDRGKPSRPRYGRRDLGGS